MNRLASEALDRHITGNWGEDQVNDEELTEAEQELVNDINQARCELGEEIMRSLSALGRATRSFERLVTLFDVEHAEGEIERDMRHYLDTARRELLNANARRTPHTS